MFKHKLLLSIFVLLCTAFSSKAQLSDEDKNFLVALKAANPSLQSSADWASNDPNTWGINPDPNKRQVFISNGRIVRLAFAGGLDGTIPALPAGSLTELRELIVYSCPNLHGELPNLCQASKLTNLTIMGGKLTGSLPNVGQNCLPKLNYLRLSVNQFTGSIPSSIGELVDLEYCDFGGNQLSGAIPSSIGGVTLPNGTKGMQKLRSLYLQGNKLTGNLPAELGNLPVLTIFSIQANQIEGEIPSNFFNPSFTPNLRSTLAYCDLSGNKLYGSIAGFKDFKELLVLRVASNLFAGEVPQELFTLPKLQDFALEFNEGLIGCIPPAITQLTTLNNVSGLRYQATGLKESDDNNTQTFLVNKASSYRTHIACKPVGITSDIYCLGSTKMPQIHLTVPADRPAGEVYTSVFLVSNPQTGGYDHLASYPPVLEGGVYKTVLDYTIPDWILGGLLAGGTIQGWLVVDSKAPNSKSPNTPTNQDGLIFKSIGFSVPSSTITTTLTTPKSIVCPNAKVTFTANANSTGAAIASYEFFINGVSKQNGAASTFTTSFTANSTVTVKVTNVAGCSATSSLNITVANVGNVALTASNSNVCAGENVVLTATGGFTSYQFFVNGQSQGQASASASYTLNNLAVGTYKVYVVAYTADGCPATSNEVVVTSNAKPVVGIDITIKATSGYANYEFKNANGDVIQNSASNEITLLNVTAQQTITLTATNAAGCKTVTRIPVGGVTVLPSVAVSENPTPAPAARTEENSLKNVDNTKVTLFPNPTENQFSVQIEGIQGKLNVTVYDLSGKLIHTKEVETTMATTQLDFDLATLPVGIYMVKVSSAIHSSTHKLVRK